MFPYTNKCLWQGIIEDEEDTNWSKWELFSQKEPFLDA